MKKFNGHRCERRNLTDLLLGTGPDGKKRPKPKAKKRPKNFTLEPARNKRYLGGPFEDPGAQLDQEYMNYMQQQQAMNMFQPQANINFGMPARGTFSSAQMPLMDRIFGEQVDMSELAPGEVADAMQQNQMRAGKVALGSAALGTVGQFVQNSDFAQQEGTAGDIATGLGGAASGLGMALPYAAMVPGLAPFAIVGGAIASVYKKKAAEQAEDRARRKRLQESQLLQTKAAEEYSRQIQNMYDAQGQTVNSYMAKHGGYMGNVDYETEGGEMMLASPADPPIGLANGGSNKMSKNLYKAVGPRHEQGGIPTAGATEEFVDAQGQSHDSPYVFSDAKEMRFDASQILSMIS